MPFALELFFDATTENVVRGLWRRLAKTGGSDYLLKNGVRPHVAPVVFDAPDPATFAGWETLARAIPRGFTLRPTGPGSFPGGVIFIGFEATPELVALHREISGFPAARGLRLPPHYEPGIWIPHCTLAQGVPPEAMEATLREARERIPEAPWEIVEFGPVSFPPTRSLGAVPVGVTTRS